LGYSGIKGLSSLLQFPQTALGITINPVQGLLGDELISLCLSDEFRYLLGCFGIEDLCGDAFFVVAHVLIYCGLNIMQLILQGLI